MDEQPVTRTAHTGLVARAKAMIVSPKPEWAEIAGERTEPAKVLTGYALPLMAIGPVATFIGQQLFAPSYAGITFRPTLAQGLTSAIVGFVLSIGVLFAIAFVANILSKNFGGRDDYPAAFRLVAYSMTAAWLAAIFGLVPALAILSLSGLYSLYVFYLGATPVLGVPQDKAAAFTAVTVLVAIVASIVMSAVVASVII